MSISPLELAQREASGALDRQATRDASLDAKLGLILALNGAILVGVFAISHAGALSTVAFIVALISTIVSTVVCLVTLIPSQGVQHPPTIPSDFALPLRGRSASVPAATLSLLNAQLRAWDRNNDDIGSKARRFVWSLRLASIGAFAFVGQALLAGATIFQ